MTSDEKGKRISAGLMGHKTSLETRMKISASLKGHGVSHETRLIMSAKARLHAQKNFEGGDNGNAYAEILCPLGFLREYYLYYGSPIVRLRHDVLRRRFFRLDFAHIEGKINIELDGLKHKRPIVKQRDEYRDRIIKEMGWKIIRIKVFPEDVRQVARDAKIGRYPEAVK